MADTNTPDLPMPLNAWFAGPGNPMVSLQLRCSEASCDYMFNGHKEASTQSALQVGQLAAINRGWSINNGHPYCPDHTAELGRRDLIHGSARRPAGDWPPAGELGRAERATVVRFGIHEEDIQNLAALAVDRVVALASWPNAFDGINCVVEGCNRSWVVQTTGDAAEATAFARRYAPIHGWSVTDAGDFCPDHATQEA